METYSFSLSEQAAEYHPVVVIDAQPCPGTGIVFLALDSPSDQGYHLHITGPGVDETASGVNSDYIPLMDYAFLGPGNFMVALYDEVQGEDCSQEVFFTLAGNQVEALFLVELTPPDNADQNNGKAVFNVDISLIILPYTIYVNGTFYGEFWEPGFVLFDLTPGEYLVELYDAVGCQAVPVSFTLFGGSGMQQPAEGITLSSCNLASSMLLNPVMQELDLRSSGEFVLDGSWVTQPEILWLPVPPASVCYNLVASQFLSTGMVSGLGFRVGHLTQMLVLSDENGKQLAAIPIRSNIAGLQWKISKSRQGKQTSLGMTLSGNFDWLLPDLQTRRILEEKLGITVSDDPVRIPSLNLKGHARRTLSEGVRISGALGTRISATDWSDFSFQPFLLVNMEVNLGK
jgi:hypothetical protein